MLIWRLLDENGFVSYTARATPRAGRAASVLAPPQPCVYRVTADIFKDILLNWKNEITGDIFHRRTSVIL